MKKSALEQEPIAESVSGRNESILDGQIVLYTFCCNASIPSMTETASPSKGKGAVPGRHGQLKMISVDDETEVILQKVKGDSLRLKNQENETAKGYSKKFSTFPNTFRNKVKTVVKAIYGNSEPPLGRSENLVDEDFLFGEESARAYRLALHFYRKFESGMKHFLFTHLGSSTSQQQSIFGIASCLNYFDNLKVAIITNRFEGSLYRKFRDMDNRVQKNVINGEDTVYCEAIDHNGVHFIEIESVSKVFKEGNVKRKEHFLKELLGDYDAVFYDIPTIENRKENFEVYFLLFRLAEDATLTLTKKKNTFSEVEKVRQYFRQYNMKFNGCIVEGSLKGLKDFNER